MPRNSPSLAADELGAAGRSSPTRTRGGTATSSAGRSASRPARSIRSSSASPSASLLEVALGRAVRGLRRSPAAAPLPAHRRGRELREPARSGSVAPPRRSRAAAANCGTPDARARTSDLAERYLGVVVRLLPAARRDWGRAMQAELATTRRPCASAGASRSAAPVRQCSRRPGRRDRGSRSLAVAGSGALVLAGEIALAGVDRRVHAAACSRSRCSPGSGGARATSARCARTGRRGSARAGGYCLVGRVPDRTGRRARACRVSSGPTRCAGARSSPSC